MSNKKDNIDMEQLKCLVLAGWDDAQVAEFYGVTSRTLYRWKRQDDSFRQTLKEWKNLADEKVELSLYKRAHGYYHPEEKIFCQDGRVTKVNTIKHYPPDPTSMIFWLKNRNSANWRDRSELKHSGEIDGIADKITIIYGQSSKPRDNTDVEARASASLTDK